MKQKPGTFNFYKEQPKKSGCRACEYNPIGICELANREVPFTSHYSNMSPKWCPKRKK